MKLTVAMFVPEVDDNYVRYGNYDDVKQIIEKQVFYPLLITGHKGNGKTQMVEQACAELKRAFLRFNFTKETDESDIIGRQRLVTVTDKNGNGSTVSEFEEAPILFALRNGLVVLIDEFDAADTNKIMCMQSILEGKGVLVKATGEWVKPAPGFQIFLSGNTKGRGSESGEYIGTQIMNGALLDRIAGTIYQDYPPREVEATILENYFIDTMWLSKGITLDAIPGTEATTGNVFISKLCEWAEQIRKTYVDNGGVGEVVTTRSLINIIRAYSIFGQPKKAVLYACERYPDDIRNMFVEIYSKLADEPTAEEAAVAPDAEADFAKENF